MKDNVLYYLVVVIILIILSTLFNNRSISFFICLAILTFIIDIFIKNIQKSFFISLFITLFLSYTNQNLEFFDNPGDDKDDSQKLVKIDDSTSDDTEFDNIEEKDQFGEDDESDEKDKKNTKNAKNAKNAKNEKDEGDEYVRAAKAQKETFRLINTIKQLDDTINGLAPTLKEGAKIIEKFKKLNLA